MMMIGFAAMDSDFPLPTQENDEPKAEFCKLTNEATYRKYGRHSPVSGSSDEDGSPKRDHFTRGNSKTSNHERKSYDNVDDRSSNQGQHGRNIDSYRHTSRGNRHDDHSRYGKHADESDKSYAKAYDRLGRESRGSTNSDFRDRESDYDRPRDYKRDADKYPRVKSDRTRCDGRHGNRYDDRDRHSRDRDYCQDEKREYRSSRDYRGDWTTSYDSNAKTETGDLKVLDSSKNKQEKSKHEGLDRPEDRHGRAGRSGDRSAFVSEEFASKRPKFSLGSDARKDEKQISTLKQGEDLAAEIPAVQGAVSGADSVTSVDAAKVAAIRAAQLVNQNLTSTGFMTADQKKKLLWGSKKSNVTEESSHRWDSALFSDRERQEKFNKLMGVKGEVKVDPKPPSSQDAEKQRELQLDLEKQYTAGLRRRDGRTVGLGL